VYHKSREVIGDLENEELRLNPEYLSSYSIPRMDAIVRMRKPKEEVSLKSVNSALEKK
jgi:hypothetical protein